MKEKETDSGFFIQDKKQVGLGKNTTMLFMDDNHIQFLIDNNEVLSINKEGEFKIKGKTVDVEKDKDIYEQFKTFVESCTKTLKNG